MNDFFDAQTASPESPGHHCHVYPGNRVETGRFLHAGSRLAGVMAAVVGHRQLHRIAVLAGAVYGSDGRVQRVHHDEFTGGFPIHLAHDTGG